MGDLTYQHKDLAAKRWQEMTFALQMANIGSEISRALRWQQKQKKEQEEKAAIRALELIDLSIEACSSDTGQSFYPRRRELSRCREEICGYFFDNNVYNTDATHLLRYFDQFAMKNLNDNRRNP